jgi:hypothetical protein
MEIEMDSIDNFNDNISAEAQEYLIKQGFIILRKNEYKKVVKALKDSLTNINEAMIDGDLEAWKPLSDKIYKALKSIKEI